MNREAIVIYLKNIRDLEVARAIIGEMYNRDKANYENKVNELNIKKIPLKKIVAFQYKPKGGCFIICAILTVLYLVVLFYLGVGAKGETGSTDWLQALMLFGAVFFGIIMFTQNPGSRKQQEDAYNRERKAIEEYNQEASNNNNSISKNLEMLRREWLEKDNFYKTEYAKVSTILQGFYAMNIVPVQYRNTSAAIYLYDFMSSSKESFQMALISNQIESGIQRIEQKLNTIIELIHGNIIETRLLREENRQRVEATIAQNNQMIRQLENIERDSYEASQYAELASNYSKANAYFSLARYLDKR